MRTTKCVDQSHRGQDAMTPPGEPFEAGLSLGLRFRFGKNPTANGDHRIGRKDD